MSDTVIKVENLSKQYRIGSKESYRTFRETLVDAAKALIKGVQNLFNPKSKIRNHLRSELIEKGDLSSKEHQILAQAVMREEDDWLDWKVAKEMLESWIGLRQEAKH